MRLQSYKGWMYLCMLTDMSAFRSDGAHLEREGFLRGGDRYAIGWP